MRGWQLRRLLAILGLVPDDGLRLAALDVLEERLPVGVDRRAVLAFAHVVPHGDAGFTGRDGVVVIAEELRREAVGTRPAGVADRAAVDGRERADGAGSII